MKKNLLYLALVATTFLQAQVILLKDANPGPSDGVGNELIAIPNTDKVIYSGTDNGTSNYLWESDGSIINTTRVLNSNTYEFPNPIQFYKWNQLDRIVFSSEISPASTPPFFPDNRVMAYNGTNIGLEEVADYNIGSDNNPKNFYAFTKSNVEYMCFSSFRNDIGDELCYLQLAPFTTLYFTTTSLIKDINPIGSSSPNDFTEYNNSIYFTADDGTNGRELHITDGLTTASTLLFKDVNPSGSSNPSELLVFNNKIYFSADDGVNGRELWISDGTTAGTIRVAAINPIAAD